MFSCFKRQVKETYWDERWSFCLEGWVGYGKYLSCTRWDGFVQCVGGNNCDGVVGQVAKSIWRKFLDKQDLLKEQALQSADRWMIFFVRTIEWIWYSY